MPNGSPEVNQKSSKLMLPHWSCFHNNGDLEQGPFRHAPFQRCKLKYLPRKHSLHTWAYQVCSDCLLLLFNWVSRTYCLRSEAMVDHQPLARDTLVPSTLMLDLVFEHSAMDKPSLAQKLGSEQANHSCQSPSYHGRIHCTAIGCICKNNFRTRGILKSLLKSWNFCLLM